MRQNKPVNRGAMLRKLVAAVAVALAATICGMLAPAQPVSVRGVGILSLDSSVQIAAGAATPLEEGNTGWLSPTAYQANHGWSDPQNAYASDDIYMTGALEKPDTASVEFYKFNIPIPAGCAAVSHIEVAVEARSSEKTDPRKVRASLMWNDQSKETTYQETDPLTTEDNLYILGTPATWGRDWNINDLSNDNFAVKITSFLKNDITLYVDQVMVRIFYLLPAADIAVSPTGKAFGTVAENSVYWSSGAAPAFPLDDAECYFTLKNNSSNDVDVSIRATDFGGGVGWRLTGDRPGQDSVRMKAGRSGDASAINMVTLTGVGQTFVSGLKKNGDKSSLKWELELETGTFSDGAPKQSTITLTATFSGH